MVLLAHLFLRRKHLNWKGLNKERYILNFSYLTNLSCSVTNVSTTSYLRLGRILSQVGKLKTLAKVALQRPLGSVTEGGLSGPAAMRGEVLWHVPFLSPPECSWGWLYYCWASPDDSQVHAKGMMMFKWQKSFLLGSHWFCTVKLDVIKLISLKLEIVTVIS